MSSRMDHEPTDGGGFHLWRGGEYLTTFAVNYGGYGMQIWNTLYIPNESARYVLGSGSPTTNPAVPYCGNQLIIPMGPNSMDRVRTQVNLIALHLHLST